MSKRIKKERIPPVKARSRASQPHGTAEEIPKQGALLEIPPQPPAQEGLLHLRDALHRYIGPEPFRPALPMPNQVRVLLEILDRHPGWFPSIPLDQPLYALPTPVIKALSEIRKIDFNATAEAEFGALCNSPHGCGYWFNGPIAHELVAGPARSYEECLKDFDDILSKKERDALVKQVEPILPGTRKLHAKRELRIEGVRGWLSSDATFAAERDALRKEWLTLPEDERPIFPLRRHLIFRLMTNYATPRPGGWCGFKDRLVSLLDKWQLSSLASWEIPHPSGPLPINLVPIDCDTYPKQGIHVYLPVHFDLRDAEDLHHDIARAQKDQAEQLGIDPSYAGVAHPKAYSNMFRIGVLDFAVRQRFPEKLPFGAQGPLNVAIAEVLGMSASMVIRHRDATMSCLEGKRGNVALLNRRQ